MIRHELGVRAVWSNNAIVGMMPPGRCQLTFQCDDLLGRFRCKHFTRLAPWLHSLRSKGYDCGSLVDITVLFVCVTGPSPTVLWWWIPREWQAVIQSVVLHRWRLQNSKVPRQVCLGSMCHQEPCIFLHYERNNACIIMNTNHQSKGATHCLNHRWCCTHFHSIFVGVQSIQCAIVTVSLCSYIHVILTL